MRKKLPVIKVTGCHDCPFCFAETCNMLDEHTSGKVSVCDANVGEYEYHKTQPGWCPGKKYDLRVEFDDDTHE